MTLAEALRLSFKAKHQATMPILNIPAGVETLPKIRRSDLCVRMGVVVKPPRYLGSGLH